MITDLSTLNKEQKTAVLESVKGNSVLLAGAGSGKTYTIIKRTEYLLNDLNVRPEEIILLTFTNKASKEIRNRLTKLTKDKIGVYKMKIGTIHSIALMLLREYGGYIGIKEVNILNETKVMNMLEAIGIGKGHILTKEDKMQICNEIDKSKSDLNQTYNISNELYKDIYQEYLYECKENNLFDFNDLMIYGVKLLENEKVADIVHKEVKYIVCDEAQDTSMIQFRLLELLVGNNNLMLVGDIQQSIYGFRDAKPEYLEKYIKENKPKVLKLEQNYRSTKTIINASNSVIANNKFGYKIDMFCNNEQGNKIKYHKAMSQMAEARYVALEIESRIRYNKNLHYSDFAVIFRINAQSRWVEEEFNRMGIPYQKQELERKASGTTKEIATLKAYVKLTQDAYDRVALRQILSNIRGIGDKSNKKITAYMINNDLSCKDIKKVIEDKVVTKSLVIGQLEEIDKILHIPYSKYSNMLIDIVDKLDLLNTSTNKYKRATLIERGRELNEFIELVKQLEEKRPDATLKELSEDIKFLESAVELPKNLQDKVTLLTAHSAKGLEFNNVFLIGVQESLFPYKRYNADSPNDIEEERRLFYVSMTRAKKMLYITNSRTIQTETGDILCDESRFLKEIPKELVETTII